MTPDVPDPTPAHDDRSGRVCWAVAVVSGIAVVASGLSPTGTLWFDLVTVTIGATLVTRVGARGPWWSRTGAAGLGAALALNPLGAVVGIVGLFVGALAADPTAPHSTNPDPASGAPNSHDHTVVDDRAQAEMPRQGDVPGRDSFSAISPGRTTGVAPSFTKRWRTWLDEHPALVSTFVSGCALNSLSRMNVADDSGLSTLIGVAATAGMVVLARRRRGLSTWPRMATRVVLAASIYALLAAAAALVAGLGVRADVGDAEGSARAGIDALEDGDYDGAADRLNEAARSFDRTGRSLGGLLTMPARLVPGLAQNVRGAQELADAGGDMASSAGRSLRDVDLDQLTVSEGAIDLDAVREVQQPMHLVRDSFVRFETTLDDSMSPWIVPPFARRLEALDAEVSEQSVRLRNVVDAVDLLPQMLGGDAPRRYLVLFTTPSEARGLGGFPGSWTTIEVSDGRVEVGDVGRIDDLNVASVLADCSGCDPEMLQRYGRFGLTTEPGDLVGPDTWSNLTIPAHFPAIADAATRLFPQATGTTIDGVIVMDPYVVQALASYGEPVSITSLDDPLPTDAIAEFILADQYLLPGDRDTRLAALEELSAGALDGVLSGDFPEPQTMLSDIAPLVAERRLLVWTTDPDEQRLLDGTGLLGDLPDLDPVDGGFSVAVTNAAGNKIDRFLTRDTTIREVRRDGQRFLRAEVTFQNGAPSVGLPEYVIGNEVDLPIGSHRLLASLYGPTAPTTTTVDGEPRPISGLPEDGWVATDVFLDFSPGQQREIVVEYPLSGDGSGEFAPTVWVQPLAIRPG